MFLEFLFCCWGVWGLRGSGGPVGVFENIKRKRIKKQGEPQNAKSKAIEKQGREVPTRPERRRNIFLVNPFLRSRFLGRGCDEALFSEKKGFSVKRGEAIQRMRGLVRISRGKAIQ